jgi:hypothetical protein
MTSYDLEEFLRALDPVGAEASFEDRDREDVIWQSIISAFDNGKPRHSRRYWSVGALGASVTTATIVVATLANVSVSAASAALNAAAVSDSRGAALAPLSVGQYYFQQSQISLVCDVSSPAMAPDAAPLSYVSVGTMDSWTASDGSGEVIITPSPVGAGGSHFATASDEARWESLGKPFIPCALSDSSNQLGGNPANANAQGSEGGYSSTVSGFSGFGLSLALSSRSSLLSAATSINNLPSSPATISTLLANGQIDTDGSLSPSPQICPLTDGSSGNSPGCTPSEQLDVIEQLMQLPDASSKLGSAFYQLLAQMPGAQLMGQVTTQDGTVGTAVQVPQGTNEAFEVVFNPTTGELLSCSELVTQSGVTTSVGSVSYGSIQIVQGQGTYPN